MAVRGKFITFEGPDDVGKSTHTGLLAEVLHGRYGHEVLVLGLPSRGPVGIYIRSDMHLLSWPVAALAFAADRAIQTETVIEPALGAGKTVLCDRYLLSGLVYSCARAGSLDHLRWLQDIERRATVPDLTLVMVNSEGTAASHRVDRREPSQYDRDRALQDRVRGLYLTDMAKFIPGHPYSRVSSDGSIEQVAGSILGALQGHGLIP